MQQINLYQAILRTPRQLLSTTQLVMAVSVLIGVLAVISTAQWWWLSRSNVQLQKAKQEQLQLIQRVEELSKQLALSSNDTDLKKTLSDKESELQDKQYVLQALTGKHFGNTSGFAEQFTGLARQHVNGVWLTGLYIHSGGEKLNLQGSTYEAELVPRLLQRLAQEPSFQGIEFKTMLMQRADKSSQIDFDLRSTAKEPG
jgi:Tfp pilus assembly protein PilN